MIYNVSYKIGSKYQGKKGSAVVFVTQGELGGKKRISKVESSVVGLDEKNILATSAELNGRRSCAGTNGEGAQRSGCRQTTCPPPLNLLLTPVDDDAARSRRRDTNRTLRLAAQPLERTLVVPEEALKSAETCAVVLAQPLLFLLAEHVF